LAHCPTNEGPRTNVQGIACTCIGLLFSGARSSGKQLASLYAGDKIEATLFDYLPDAAFKNVLNLEDFARVLVLDKWTCNSDGRQAIFKRQSARSQGYTATFIDQGFCFNAGEWTFPGFAIARSVCEEPGI